MLLLIHPDMKSSETTQLKTMVALCFVTTTTGHANKNDRRTLTLRFDRYAGDQFMCCLLLSIHADIRGVTGNVHRESCA